MRCIAIVCLIAIGTSALAERPAEEARKTMNVYVLENVNDPGLNLGWAKSVTPHIFAESGVRIKWRLGQLRRGQPDMPIIIDLRANAPKTLAPGALAFVQVYEGVHICVFADRVKETVRGANPLATFVLAHVMAHEITHVLEGMDHHSKAGLMKPSWTKDEIQQMSIRPLLLAPEDVQLIHLSLLKR